MIFPFNGKEIKSTLSNVIILLVVGNCLFYIHAHKRK